MGRLEAPVGTGDLGQGRAVEAEGLDDRAQRALDPVVDLVDVGVDEPRRDLGDEALEADRFGEVAVRGARSPVESTRQGQ